MPLKKLLVADDSLTIQKVVKLALANEGYEIQSVSDGIEASTQLPLFRPDIVLIDASLPGKSAYDVKSEYNHALDHFDSRFILMSSAHEQVDEAQASALLFDGRLVKPFELEPARLKQILGEVLQKRPKTVAPEPTFTPPPPPPPSLSGPEDLWEPAAAPMAAGEDIRRLTEETIKMSGLDSMNWNVNEPAAKVPPMPPTPPAFTPPSSPLSQMGERTLTGLHLTEPVLPPPGIFADLDSPSEQPGEVTLSDFGNERLEISTQIQMPPPAPSRVSTPPPTFSAPASPQVIPLSSGQMEEIVRSQIQSTLQEMVQRMLPDIAERVLKQEIHKLLSAPPHS
jgi:CheY-like chemotaxis protein